MEIRIRETGAVVTESEFRSLHSNTSFPALTQEVLNDFGADAVLEGAQPTVERYQVAYRDGVEQINGKWFTKYAVADLDDEAKTSKDVEQAKAVRATRNQMLKESDWTQLADATLSEETITAWATYRQALRDISTQSGFPWEIVWPTQP